MTTSLAEQLKRLATPQTTQLVDSKKRASILFDVREAANKDRETIFDIGCSGLLELTALNPTFLQFEQTLFSRTARDLVRNIESADANRDLNKTIRKFLHHLSPHFLLQPAHKCLEWLIRRFHIHEYNIDDFMMLILPYHETRMFVKCVQIMPLRNEKNPWHWLHIIQKPGIILSKQVLFNRAATDRFLLKFLCKSTSDAVRELDLRAYTLQALFAFYCTTVLGALDTAMQITHDHISIVYATVSRGLVSSVVDFCAASIMITGQLVVKAKLTQKFLDGIVSKLARIQHPGLQSEAIVLLVLVFQTQQESMQSGLSDESLDLITRSKWISSVLGKAYAEGIHILPLYLPLIGCCLKSVQLKEREWKTCMAFCENLLTEVIFKVADAAPVIRCILHAYVLRDKQDTTDGVITIDSDDDDNEIELTDDNVDVNIWYSELLKSLDRQYPVVFDKITKEILKELDSSSNSKRKSLKTVLGFLYTAACSDDGANIFENLYHYSATNRIAAMRHLVKNMRKMCFSDDSKNLLRDSIAERLTDDSLLVVNETLKFTTTELVQMLDRQHLADKLLYGLSRCINDHRYTHSSTTIMILKHITSSLVWTETNAEEIFLAVWPFLMPMQKPNDRITETIVSSDLATQFPFLQRCALTSVDHTKVQAHVMNVLNARHGLPDIRRIIAVIQTIPDKRITVARAYFNVLLLAHTMPNHCPADLARDVIDLMLKFSQHLKDRLILTGDDKTVIMHLAVLRNKYPIEMNLMCINNVIGAVGSGAVMDHLDFANQNDTLSLLLQIFKILLAGLWHSKETENQLYQRSISTFLDTVLPRTVDKVEFFTNFYISHAVVNVNQSASFVCVGAVQQIQAIRVFNTVLAKSNGDINITLNAFIRILSGLMSPHAAIRSCTIKTLKLLSNLESLQPAHELCIQKLLKRHEELKLDATQLALILYRMCCTSKSSQITLQPLLDDMFGCVADPNVANILQATVLEMLKHVNGTQHLRRIASAPLSIFTMAAAVSADHQKPYILNRYESQIIRSVLFHFNNENSQVLKSTPACWDVIVQSLQNHNLLLSPTGGAAATSSGEAVAIIAMDTITVPIFEALLQHQRTQLIREVVRLTAISQNTDILQAATKLMRRIDIDAKYHLDIFVSMQKVDMNVDTANAGGRKRKSRSAQLALSTDIIATTEWRCGIAMLEYLQNKHNLRNAHLLLPELFAVLKRCLKFEDQSLVEYSKQLALACMLHCCQLIAPDGQPKRDLLPDKVFEIELVVQCIRGTQNPQTHHYALQLLSHTAAMIPESVLHNMMNIFTFVGSSVVRRDDAYTYQIISNIIKSIIPTLIKSNRTQGRDAQDEAVIPVLRVFADIILDVPEHRRLRLYEDLLNTLDPHQYTWMFLAVLFESHVSNFSKSQKRDDPMQLKRIDIAIEIINQFECGVVLETCTRLIEYLHDQPVEKAVDADGGDPKMDIDITDSSIFNVHNYSNYQLRHFKYTTLLFVIRLTERASRFVTKVAGLDAVETAALNPYFKHIIVTVLLFIGKVVKLAAAAEEKFWKIILTNCYDILDHVLALIYPDMLLQVVSGLLNKNNIPEVRRKAIELLNKKLQQPNFFATCKQNTLLGLLDPLIDIIESTIDDSKLVKNATVAENISLQQQSTIAIKLLSIHLAGEHPAAFKPVLDILSAIVKKSNTIPLNVLAQSILCLAEICSNLRAHAISHLSKFMPSIGRILHSQIRFVNTTPNIVLYILMAVYKIVETLPLFLSPYLVNLILSLSQIWAKLNDQTSVDAQRKLSKLDAIWKKMANALTLRILIPMIDQSYNKCIQDCESSAAVGPLMKLLAESLVHLSGADIQPYQNDLGAFFVRALQFRSENQLLDAGTVNAHEDHIIDAFVGLVLKLSESSFRPLYFKIYDSAIRGETSVERAITFYRLSSRIAESLKSLFVLFASDFLQNAADLLRKCICVNDAQPAYTSNENCASLISSILRTLFFIFMHDSQGFINGDRFELLLQPIVDQLTNSIVLADEKIKEQIPACLAQLAVAVNDDTMWKRLNYQILLHTRNTNSHIRLFAITSCVEIAKKLGNDFLPLLPETIPFFAEMLEDENADVEKACQASVQELERVLGEPLQKYF